MRIVRTSDLIFRVFLFLYFPSESSILEESLNWTLKLKRSSCQRGIMEAGGRMVRMHACHAHFPYASCQLPDVWEPCIHYAHLVLMSSGLGYTMLSQYSEQGSPHSLNFMTFSFLVEVVGRMGFGTWGGWIYLSLSSLLCLVLWISMHLSELLFIPFKT